MRAARASAVVFAGQPAKAASPSTAERVNAYLEREGLLDQAIHDGRISANLRDHYKRCYDADPAGTRAFFTRLGVRATNASSPTPSEADEYPTDHLSPAEREAIEKSRRGERTGVFVEGGC
jgi:hypothetical protein